MASFWCQTPDNCSGAASAREPQALGLTSLQYSYLAYSTQSHALAYTIIQVCYIVMFRPKRMASIFKSCAVWHGGTLHLPFSQRVYTRTCKCLFTDCVCSLESLVFTAHRTLPDQTRSRCHAQPWRSSSQKRLWCIELPGSLQSRGQAALEPVADPERLACS